MGWSSCGPLFGGVCHRIRLPLWVPKQVPAGALPPGDWQRIPADVREVLRPRLGVPVPAQPPAYQLCGPANGKPGLHEPRLVASMFSSIYAESWFQNWLSQYLVKAFLFLREISKGPMSSTIAELWIKSRNWRNWNGICCWGIDLNSVFWETDKRFCLDLPVHHFTDAPTSSLTCQTGSEVPQCCLLLLRIRIWFLVQKIQSWCELSHSWLTLKPLRSQWFYLRFFFCRGQQQAQGAGSYSPISFCFVSFCVNPGNSAWCSSSLCLSLLLLPYMWCILFADGLLYRAAHAETIVSYSAGVRKVRL